MPDEMHNQKFLICDLFGEIWMDNLYLDDAMNLINMMNDKTHFYPV